MPSARLSSAVDALRGAPVADRLLRVLREPADRAFMALGRPPFRVAVEGHILAGYLRHRGYVAHLAAGYEDFARNLFADALAPGATVVDGGAHIGLYTLMASPRVGANGRVYAFEGDPYNAIALHRNVRANRFANVEVVACALADEVGEAAYYVSSGTIASALVNKTYVDDAAEIAVQTTTVDAVLGTHPAAHLVMKLDVEGAEERVLRGARRTVACCSSAQVLVENNPAALRDGNSSGGAVLGVLRELGLTPFFVDEACRELVPIAAGEEPTQKGNIWATKGV